MRQSVGAVSLCCKYGNRQSTANTFFIKCIGICIDYTVHLLSILTTLNLCRGLDKGYICLLNGRHCQWLTNHLSCSCFEHLKCFFKKTFLRWPLWIFFFINELNMARIMLSATILGCWVSHSRLFHSVLKQRVTSMRWAVWNTYQFDVNLSTSLVKIDSMSHKSIFYLSRLLVYVLANMLLTCRVFLCVQWLKWRFLWV